MRATKKHLSTQATHTWLQVLEACGQTGSRLHLGADAASTRYTYTRLMPYTKMIFDERDEAVLTQCEIEGHKCEWSTYAPILPMILVNGCNGIATGYRSQIPCHNPLELIDNLLTKLDGGEFQRFEPWYGPEWRGRVHTNGDWTFDGVAEQKGNRVVISDLGVGIATEKYKNSVLSKLLEEKHVLSVVEAHPSENHVRFELVVGQSFNMDMLKIDSKMSRKCINLMVSGKICHFETTMEVLEHYYGWRLALYGQRKEVMLRGWGAQLEELTHKRNFIQGVLEERIPLRRAKKDDVIAAAVGIGIPEALVKDKFCSMTLLSLTSERIAQLDGEIADIKKAVAAMRASSAAKLWKSDLKKLKPVVHKFVYRAAAAASAAAAGGKKRKSAGGGSKGKKAKR